MNILHNLDPGRGSGPLNFSHGMFPEQWKTANDPSPQEGLKSDPSKYRPISLLTIISKVMEIAVHRQLQAYLRHNLISNKQYGFRPNHSTADLLTVLSQTWNNIQDKGDEVCIVALDIKGAFDQVWHNVLCASSQQRA